MKMPKNTDEKMIAPCGVNCLACSAHLDDKRPCPGCRASIEKITRKSCRNCEIKKCAYEKDLQWCFECSEFPCAKIKSLDQRYQKNYHVSLVQNGTDARADMAAFLTAQQEYFTCKSCGGVIDQHRQRCSECGNDEQLN